MNSYSSHEKASFESTEDENSHFLSNDSEVITKLKAENFHLRLRCHDLDQQLSSCNCFREVTDESHNKTSFYDQRIELAKAIQSRQDLMFKYESLEAENKRLNDKFGCLKDDFQEKYYSYDGLKLKYDQLKEVVESKGVIHDFTGIIGDSYTLTSTNAELLEEIVNLKNQLNNKNHLLLEDERKRRKSLTHSLNKMFKDTNDSSLNISKNVSVSCIQCSELKVYSDKLSENIIKMTVDFESLNLMKELINKENEDLKNQIDKCKAITKKSLRRYDEGKHENEEICKNYDRLIEFYIIQQGEQQMEIVALKRQIREEKDKQRLELSVLKRQIEEEREKLEQVQLSALRKEASEERDKISNMFSKKLSEVMEAQKQMSSSIKSANMSLSRQQEDYDQVGQYSPQYRINPSDIHNSTFGSVTDGDRTISMNETAFRLTTDDSVIYDEDQLNDAIDNLRKKVSELGDVVKGYVGMLREDNQAVAAGDAKNDEEETHDNSVLMRLYEEEKHRYEGRLAEQTATISSLAKRTASHEEESRALGAELALAVRRCQEAESTVSRGQREMATLEETNANQLLELDAARQRCESLRRDVDMQTAAFDQKTSEMKEEIETLARGKLDYMEISMKANQNFVMQLEQMEKVKNRLREIVSVPAGDSNGSDVMEVFRLLEVVAEAFQDGRHTDSDRENSWAVSRGEPAARDREVKTHECNTGAVVDGAHAFLDLTNVTELDTEDPLPEIQQEMALADSSDKYRYIKENPEKVHQKMKHYRETCLHLKSLVLAKHETNKALKKKLQSSPCQLVYQLTREIDEFKRQLDLCRQCLGKLPKDLPESVVEELSRLNLF